jgi:hypothetical protein
MTCPQCRCFCSDDSLECPCGYRFPTDSSPKAQPLAQGGARLQRLLLGERDAKAGLLRLGLLLCLLLWALALAFDDRLPANTDILPPLFAEPRQWSENLPAPFSVRVKKSIYVVKPLYHYELAGLVVSQHRSDSFLDIHHRRWRDFLNIKDLCVVWGHNIRSGVYLRMKFWNRDFTCLCRFPDGETGALFSERHLSNNHLLSADKAMRRRILRARPGDQVHFGGYLVQYSQPANQFFRGSSTVRDDTGNGACETVYVTEFQILQRANPFWRAAKPLALLAAGIIFVLLLLA